jgi:Uma2 family endonuclease
MTAPPVSSPLALNFESAGMLMTPEEFDAVEVYDPEYCYELIHGVLVVTPIPLAHETDPNEELGRLLRNYREEHPEGRILDSTLPQQYVFTRTSWRLADRLIWTGLGRRMPDRRRDLPTIAVEFVSAGKRSRRRDCEEKRREYMELQIPEYWIIDRFEHKLSVVTSGPAGPQDQIFLEHQNYTTPHLPGFELPLQTLIRLGNRWEASPEA